MEDSKTLEHSKNWYDFGTEVLGDFGTEEFMRSACSAIALINELGLFDALISLRVAQADTAFINMANFQITIPHHYFTEEFYVNTFGLEEGSEDIKFYAISIINGNIIHEALHARFTPTNWVSVVRTSSRYYEARAIFSEEVLFMFFNIFEDIYIESKTPIKVMDFIKATQRCLFPVERLTSIKDVTAFEDFVNTAILFKNEELRSNPHFNTLLTKEQIYLLKRATYERRDANFTIKLALDFLLTYEIEADEVSSSDSDSSDSDSSDDLSDDSSDDSSDSDSSGVIDSDLNENGSSSESKELSEEEKELIEELDEVAKSMSKDIRDEIEEARKDASHSHKVESEYREKTCSWGTLQEKDVMDKYFDGRTPRVEPVHEIDTSFVNELVARRANRRVVGRARKTGSKMPKARLTRILTDQKVFARSDADRMRGKHMEIIINIDFSGSTSGEVIDNELGAAQDISDALRNARISHAVYGHTSLLSVNPFCFHIYSYDMLETNPNPSERFDRARRVVLSQNLDGVIIDHLSNKFTTRDGMKYMINLSDGSPCAPDYNNEAAADHTRLMINKARDKGILVFSLSVVPHVVENNDEIYGREWNINASHGTVRGFSKLIQKLAF